MADNVISVNSTAFNVDMAFVLPMRSSVAVRVFTSDRYAIASATGSDRDGGSNTAHVDGVEKELMRAFGIQSPSAVTYVSPAEHAGGTLCVTSGFDDAVAVYDRSKLFKIGVESNGFHAFTDTPANALVALFELVPKAT